MSGDVRFADRFDAGRRLADRLGRYRDRDDVIVLGLPRGGVPVAAEVAGALDAPLDVFVVRKLGVPGHEELAMGAIASGGVRVLNDDVVRSVGIREELLEAVTARERETLEAQERAYRGDAATLDVAGRTAILVDDGLATGATMRAAIRALRGLRAAAIVVAVPTAPRDTCEALGREVEDVVCATTPEPFTAVGIWYRDFRPVSDEQVRQLLRGGDAPPS
jgi:putative phosphoribosyl transferase